MIKREVSDRDGQMESLRKKLWQFCSILLLIEKKKGSKAQKRDRNFEGAPPPPPPPPPPVTPPLNLRLCPRISHFFLLFLRIGLLFLLFLYWGGNR